MDEGFGSASPAGLAFLFCMIALTWSLPRRLAAMPLLITTCYMPLGQYFSIAGANFTFFRVLIFIGWSRAAVRGETKDLKFSRLDKVFIWWLVVTLVLGVFTQPSVFSERLINRCGEVYGAAGTYFLMRFWIRDLDELVGLLRNLALLIVPLTAFIILEKSTGRNVFSMFGGVPEFTEVRDGKLRAQGAFRHPILAGTYGATLVPLFVALWFQPGGNRLRAFVGITCAMIVTVSSASSGAFLALLSIIMGFALWPFRRSMRFFRRGIVAVLVLLSLTMSAPVWYVFSRLSEITGGTGWYRSYLIDQAIRYFNEWWLVGTRYTAHWAPGGEVMTGNPGNTDILNQYISEGLDGGILKSALFIAMIVVGYKNVGRFTRSPHLISPGHRFLIWSLGVCLSAHCLSFFSVVYFDQMVVMWYWLLTCLALLANIYEVELIRSLDLEESAFESTPAAPF